MSADEFLSRVVTDDIKLRAISMFAESCPEIFEADDDGNLGEGIGTVLSLGIMYGMLLQREGIEMDGETMVALQMMFPEIPESLELLKSS